MIAMFTLVLSSSEDFGEYINTVKNEVHLALAAIQVTRRCANSSRKDTFAVESYAE